MAFVKNSKLNTIPTIVYKKNVVDFLEKYYWTNFNRKFQSYYSTEEYNRMKTNDSIACNIAIVANPPSCVLSKQLITDAKILIVYCYFCDMDNFNYKKRGPTILGNQENYQNGIYSLKINPFAKQLKSDLTSFFAMQNVPEASINIVNFIGDGKADVDLFFEKCELYKTLSKIKKI